MDTCEQILRALVRHEDSWPFTQAVNVREVGYDCSPTEFFSLIYWNY